MIKEAAIKLNERWIRETQDIIDTHEEKIAVLRKKIASHEERIARLNGEEAE
jgi:hypothetical protein